MLVLISNRLTRPSSEHALADWLETDYVGDRGMVTESNLKLLNEKQDHGFLVGMTRRQNPEAEALIDRAAMTYDETC